MKREGPYSVYKNAPEKSTSLKSFICALLVFTILCLTLYISLMLVNKNLKEGVSEYLVLTNTPIIPKYEETTEGHTSVTTEGYIFTDNLSEDITNRGYYKNDSKLMKTDEPSPPELCQINICKTTASRMLYFINHAQDPCIDFYDFVCGTQSGELEQLQYQNFQIILDYLNTVDISSKPYLKIFKKFYNSCFNHESDFKFIDRTKILRQNPTNSLNELFVNLVLAQSMPFFDIGLDVGEDSQFNFELTLPGHSSLKTHVRGWSIYEQIQKECLKEQKQKMYQRYLNLDDLYTVYKECRQRRIKEHVQNFIEGLQLISDQNTYNSNMYGEENVKRLIDLLDTAMDMQPTEYELQLAKTKKNFKKFSIKQLGDRYGVVSWKEFFENITINKTIFTENDTVNVYFSEYMDGIFKELEKYHYRGHLIDVLDLFSKLQIFENTIISKQKDTREQYCMDLTIQLMPDVLVIIIYDTRKNLRNINIHSYNIKMGGLFEKLKARFRESLNAIELQVGTKMREFFEEKLNLVELGLISTGNYKAAEQNYESISISNTSDNYQEDVMRLLSNFRNIIYSLKGSVVSPKSLLHYFVSPFSRQPVSFFPSKYIVTHPPIFVSMELPEYIYLAKIGMHLSRALMKHIDPVGIRYTTNNLTINGMDDFSSYLKEKTYNLLMDVYKKNLENFHGKTLTFKMNGDLFLNELIVDNAAFRLTFDYFTTLPNQASLPYIFPSYSIEKIFFIAAAQEYCTKISILDFMVDINESEHLPPILKVQNVVINSEEFSKIFRCKDGDAMKIRDNKYIAQFPNIGFANENFLTTNN